MWNIIPQIGTPIALIAFGLAIFYYYQRQRLENRLETFNPCQPKNGRNWSK